MIGLRFKLIALGVVVALAGVAYAVYRIDANGYSRCEVKFAKEAIEAEQASTKNIEKIREASEKFREELYNAPKTDEENIIAPVLSDVLDGLHARHPAED